MSYGAKTLTQTYTKIKATQGILKANKHSPKHQGKVRERAKRYSKYREKSGPALKIGSALLNRWVPVHRQRP